MPRIPVVIRAAMVASIIGVSLVGCTQAPQPVVTDSCAGMIEKVLLSDDSATTVTAFDPADIPKEFGISATPKPTCYYKTATPPAASNGVSYIVTHRTLLYIGLSDADTAALVAAVTKTASVAPWNLSYNNPATTATPPPESVSSSASWNYNNAAGPQDDRGSMSYYEARPVNQGTAIHAGLSSSVNVVRIETELRQVAK